MNPKSLKTETSITQPHTQLSFQQFSTPAEPDEKLVHVAGDVDDGDAEQQPGVSSDLCQHRDPRVIEHGLLHLDRGLDVELDVGGVRVLLAVEGEAEEDLDGGAGDAAQAALAVGGEVSAMTVVRQGEGKLVSLQFIFCIESATILITKIML